ncbi:HAD family hydrolase [Kocuria turfanensis]|uniref:Haloacid dehalogenase n=1 Tax=Kocuria turfanensis TaxID=388357 RepID=A0A512IBK2_9MICC|nr:HAD family phosphatase [Kocuria turfanensis]GEO95078.1 haloacid dehalogenase [Kocuria turfanensis]
MSSPGFPHAVLFDHDGTLVDTEPLWDRAKQDLAAEHGRIWTPQDTDDTLGRPVAATIDRMRQIGVPLDDDEMFRAIFEHSVRVLEGTELTFIDGIGELLTELADAGIPAAIVTNASSALARHTAAAAPPGLVRTTVGTDDYARGVRPKPDPDAYLTAARRLGVDPARCVVVEDSPAGAAAGVAAGMPTVVVPGEKAVEPGPGLLHLRSHRELTLALLRSLDPQSPSSPFHPAQEARP